ncbi:restriction endonuclease subunit S [Vibrio parahaemolyticus]|uniref:restriction endonuclease subunit S n=1 Tax=Vibrio parahaemolyticus TaxID=670 RepID=UPI0004235DDE|nr:restriction endonuclease subunit S [Vibrio parahaemolyticus]AUW38677.1 restriction endonuclease subunit S [Vibrio parahaemolyticus]EGR0427800.1 restriction endonuclease subunit S [Vibrio parahaemolyticus]EJG0785527.1 restriction endonuclease subunit S [Vibrio parahaemolyticus]EJG1592240.1 restriction endonuclease subunit S [Vibrio parahaemolyticus]MBY7693548.1 restriction endonuclease subunit S [Vibrio parahaemolyticus]
MRTLKLSECCSFFSGGTPSKSKNEYWKGTIPWFSPKDIKSFNLTSSQDHISETAINESATRLINPGTILLVGRMLSRTLPIGIVRQPSAFNQDIKAIVPNEEFDPEYVALFLLAKQDYVLRHGVKIGPTVNSIISGFIENIEIPKFSIEQQRKIATGLKAQLAEVETARHAAQVQLSDVHLLRARMLKAFFAELDSVPKKRLGDNAPTTSGSTPSRGNKQYWEPAEIAWVKTGEVAFTPITSTKEAISNLALAECSVKLLPPKSVLIAMIGQGKTRGQSAILEIPATTNQNCFAVMPNDTWEPEFLYLWMKSSYQDLRDLSSDRGGSQSALNGTLLNALEVPAPTKAEQLKLVARIQSAMTEIDALEQSTKAKLADIEKLPARILAKSFEN